MTLRYADEPAQTARFSTRKNSSDIVHSKNVAQ